MLCRKVGGAMTISSETASNEAVGIALAEDGEDLKAFQIRAQEPNLDFAKVVRSLKRIGKL